MSHTCPDCGLEHGVDVVEAAPEVDLEPAADAAVEIARIEADRDVTLGKIHAKTEEAWQESRVAELEGRITGMQEILDQLKPEPEPEPVPVIIDEPTPEPIAPEPAALPPPLTEPADTGKKKKSNVWW